MSAFQVFLMIFLSPMALQLQDAGGRQGSDSSGPPFPESAPVPSRAVNSRDPWAGILSGPVDGPARLRATYPEIAATSGLAVRHRASGFTGVVVGLDGDGGVVVRGATGLERLFRPTAGAFDVEGRAVSLVRPQPPTTALPTASAITTSGSLAVTGHRAKVARASRILVEGVHDAELVEKVWGDDLRIEGVVVERLDGIDHLPGVVDHFRPGPGNRVGILVDHLVPGSKEARLAETIRHPHVLVTGTPFVDVWEAVKPAAVGILAWPDIPRGTDWKSGVCQWLGVGDPPAMWRHILASVRSYADLEPALVGAVESLIDFVTEPDT